MAAGNTRKSKTLRATPKARKSTAKKPRTKKWSAEVMQKSDAMDLTPGVFKLRSPKAVARSLKRSAELSLRRKATPFRSAMSMLNFEINRGGKNLTADQKRILNQAKGELRKLFDRPPA